MIKLLPPPRTIEVAAAAVLASFMFASVGLAATETQKPLAREWIGTWALVAADVRHPDGSVGRDYGDAPKGTMMIDAKGRYALLIFNSNRRAYASGDRATGTPEEYRETVTGISTHIGTFAADAAKKVLTFSIEQASYPNWNGAKLDRPYELKSGVLRYNGAARPNGDVPISIWKKMP